MTPINIFALGLPAKDDLAIRSFVNDIDFVNKYESIPVDSEVENLLDTDTISIIIVDYSFKYLNIFKFIELCTHPGVYVVVISNSEEITSFNFRKIYILQRPYRFDEFLYIVIHIMQLGDPEKKVFFNNSDIGIIGVPSIDKIDFIKKQDIVYCAADGKYTTFYLNDGMSVVSSKNLGVYEKILGSSFIRLHHSFLVNLKFVTSILKKDSFSCVLTNGVSLPVSKRKQDCFNKFFKYS